MSDGSSVLHLRRFVVDVLIGVSMVAVAFAATGAAAEVPYLLLILGASALVGIAVVLEPKEAGPARIERQPMEGCDAAIADAASA